MSKKNNDKAEEKKNVAITYSIIMIGDSAAGKTSLVERYLHGTFEDAKMSTIGFEKYRKRIQVGELFYDLDIMDTTGQERYASLGVQYFRNCDGAILVYDVSQKTSFENIENWLEKLTENNSESVPYVIFENKIDKEQKEWEVQREEVEVLKEKLKVDFLPVSAKTGQNVEDAFLTIAKKVIEKNKDFEVKARLQLTKGGHKKNSCC